MIKSVVLALGSNLGNRHENLINAVNKLKAKITDLKVSNIYENKALLPEGAPQEWDLPYYNIAISGNTMLAPEDLLYFVKEIEKELGRKPSAIWAPRLIDIDIIFYGQERIESVDLTIPHKDAHTRPFVMIPVAQIAPEFVHPKLGQNVKAILGNCDMIRGAFDRVIPFHPLLMGTLNYTPDSFSNKAGDFSIENCVNSAVQHARSGAYYLDIGAIATNPRAVQTNAEIELDRVKTVMPAIKAELLRHALHPKLSVDTFDHVVLEHILENYNIDVINDQSFARNKRFLQIAAHSQKDYVLMHSMSLPVNSNETVPFEHNAADFIFNQFAYKLQELEKMGFERSKIIVDPGVGFAKNAAQCVELIRSLPKLRELGCRILLGHSRKLFIGLMSSAPFYERDLKTAVISALVAENCDIIRVHNTESSARSIATARFFTA